MFDLPQIDLDNKPFKRPSEAVYSNQAHPYLGSTERPVADLLGHLKPQSKAESSPTYSKTIATLNEAHRLVICKDDLQWIIQRLYGQKYEGIRYCRSKRGLLRSINDLRFTLSPEGKAAIDSLPDWIGF